MDIKRFRPGRRVAVAAALVSLVAAAGPAFGSPRPDDPSVISAEDNFSMTGGVSSAPDGSELFADLPTGGFAGYSTGTVFYSDAHLSGERRTDVELGFSSASFSSSATGVRRNELDRRVAPSLTAGEGFGRGSALDLAFNQEEGSFEEDLPDFNDEAEAKAPPSREPQTAEQSGLVLTPIADVHSLKAQASARSVPDGCVLGSDLAFGLGSATNAELVKASGDDKGVVSAAGTKPRRGVSQTVSRTRLIPVEGSGPGGFGLMAESRETIAPITVLEGKQELTIEVGGEWVLRALSDGTTGKLTFGPEAEAGNERPLLRVLNADREPVDEVMLQDYLGSGGLVVEVEGLIEIVLGEDPRAITGNHDSLPSASATGVSGATDVLRVKALDEIAADFSELRVGHLEAAVAIPAGGLVCPGVQVGKAIDRRSVKPGEQFVTTITVTNPNDCILDDVTLTETITATPGVAYTARADRVTPRKDATSTTLTFEDIGPLQRGEAKVVKVAVDVSDGSASGLFGDRAVATGRCGRSSISDDESGGVAPPAQVTGEARLDGPEVTTRERRDAAIPLTTPPPPRAGPTPANPPGPTARPGAPAPAGEVPTATRAGTRPSGDSRPRPATNDSAVVSAGTSTAPSATGAPPGSLARSGGPVGFGVGLGLVLIGIALWLVGRLAPLAARRMR